MAQINVRRRMPVWPRVFGVVLILAGLALLVGGVQLARLGGSWYYLLAGAMTLLSGLLLARAKPVGAMLYLVLVAVTGVWALVEVGDTYWGLVPRLAPVLVLGLFAALALRALPSPAQVVAWPVAVVQLAVLVAGGASVLQPHGVLENTDHLGPVVPNAVAVVRDAHSPANRWDHYGRDALGQRFAPFDQITPANVQQLEVAWTYRTGAQTGGGNEDQNTPIQVDDTLYLCTPQNKVIALDAETGREKWVFDPHTRDNPWWSRCRGVAYYAMPSVGMEAARTLQAGAGAAETAVKPTDVQGSATNLVAAALATPAAAGDGDRVAAPADASAPLPAPVRSSDARGAGHCRTRIITTDKDARLWALDAQTGTVCTDFGDSKKGFTDLSAGMGAYPDFYYMPTSQPLVAGDRVVIGGWVWDGKKTGQPSGVVRAYKLQDGTLDWAWDLGNPAITGLPSPGQTYTPGTPNFWSHGAYDAQRDLIYLPLGNATPDFWGAHRTPAMNRYATSVVALHGATGREAWHFQSVHMDTWDYDNGTPPTLLDMPNGQGGSTPALVLATKTHQLFVLNRVTGEPLANVQERPAPQRTMAGDAPAAATQPWSQGMPQVAKQTLTEKDMWGATMFDQLYCRIQFKKLHYEGPYTKLTNRMTLIYPGYYGGFNWGAEAYDPRTGMLIVNDMLMPQIGFLHPQAGAAEKLAALKQNDLTHAGWTTHVQEGTPYQAIRGAFNSFLGLPCHQPPWGNLTAIDLHTRRMAWQVPLGTVEDSRLLGRRFGLPVPLGMPSLAGPFATAGGLVFYAGTQDYYLRAFDSASGHELWKARLPVGAQSTPMGYLSPASGRQFVVVSAGGARMTPDKGDYVIAYALPRR